MVDRIYEEMVEYGISYDEAKRNIAKEDLLDFIDKIESIEDIKKVLKVLTKELI